VKVRLVRGAQIRFRLQTDRIEQRGSALRTPHPGAGPS
jgi:hypothetical protein